MVVVSNPKYARHLLTSVLKNDPANARALAELGVSYQMESDFQQAEPLMREAVALEDGDYLLLTELADLLVARCRAKSKTSECADSDVQREALSLYQQAQALNPDSPETLANYASALLKAGKPEQALDLLKRAYRAAPSAYTVVLDLGIAHAQAGHWGPARTFLERAAGWAVDVPEERARVRDLLRQVQAAAERQPPQTGQSAMVPTPLRTTPPPR